MMCYKYCRKTCFAQGSENTSHPFIVSHWCLKHQEPSQSELTFQRCDQFTDMGMGMGWWNTFWVGHHRGGRNIWVQDLEAGDTQTWATRTRMADCYVALIMKKVEKLDRKQDRLCTPKPHLPSSHSLPSAKLYPLKVPQTPKQTYELVTKPWNMWVHGVNFTSLSQ